MFRIAAVLTATLTIASQPVFAQPSARNQLQSGFNAKAPAIGAELPDASGYTADGEPFNLRDLRGEYTVLVFGCLT